MCDCGYNNKFFWPVTLIFVGVIVLMINLGVLSPTLWRLWPIVLVIVGLVGITSGCDSCNPVKKMSAKPSSKKKKK